jgi:diacylglycerol kinase
VTAAVADKTSFGCAKDIGLAAVKMSLIWAAVTWVVILL